MKIIKKLKVNKEFNLSGRGPVWLINLKENEISHERKLIKELMGTMVTQDGVHGYGVIGVELFAAGEGYVHLNAGLLVRGPFIIKPPVNKE